MEQKLKAERRLGSGKGVARKIRAAGRVPGVVYGHAVEPVHITVDARELLHTLHTEAGANVLVDLRIGGEHVLAMPREVQRDHLRGRLTHVDFLRIARDEKITVEVPIQLIGESHGVREGGVIEHHLWNLEVECFPQDVPTHIDADITKVGINESLKVADLTLPSKVIALTDDDETVVSVVPPQVLMVEEEVEEEAIEAAAAGEGEPVQEPPTEGARGAES
jgi:large subunit ribosomal protein L25